MRTHIVSPFVIFLLSVLVLAGCSKDSGGIGSNNGNTGSSGGSNSAPLCFAGNDLDAWLPHTYDIVLNGAATDAEGNIRTIRWNRISGTGIVQIDFGETLYPRVRGLTEGVHLFELTVTDAGGLSGRDTVQVNVYPDLSIPGEKIFGNRQWRLEGLNGPLLWGSSIIIRNVFSYLPPGTASFRAYIRRDGSSAWVLLDPPHPPQFPYYYQVQNGTFIVFVDTEESDTPDIKLVY